MKTKDIVIGLAVVALITAGVLAARNSRDAKLKASLENAPTAEERIEEKFGGLQVPDDVEKAELKDVSGGDGYGIATRSEVLADLPELSGGKVYQVWLEKNASKVLLGNMRVAKGGYLLEYSSAKFPGYDKVVITLDGNNVLEGSF